MHVLRDSSLVLAALAAALLVPLEAAAQHCPTAVENTPAQTRALAGEAFSEGQRLFDAGELQAALARFECSYSLVPHPNTLFNLGECAAALGDPQRALGYFRELLRRFPEDRSRAEVEERIGQLEARVLASRSSQPPQTDEPDPDQGEVLAPEPQPAPQPHTRRMSLARRFAWGTLGAGLALTVVGIGLYGGAVSVNHRFVEVQNKASASMGEVLDMRDRGRGLEGGGWALMSLGLASLVASVLLFVLFDATTPLLPGSSTSSNP